MTAPQHDFSAAVESLVAIHTGNPGRPPLHFPAPVQPRVIPARPLPRHLTNPTPRRRWGTDLATVTRNRRVRPALGRIVAAIRRTAA